MQEVLPAAVPNGGILKKKKKSQLLSQEEKKILYSFDQTVDVIYPPAGCFLSLTALLLPVFFFPTLRNSLWLSQKLL